MIAYNNCKIRLYDLSPDLWQSKCLKLDTYDSL